MYYYDPTVPSKYCVINYEGYYDTQRLLLNFGSALVILFTVLGFPLLFVELYQPVIEKLNDSSGSEYWRFIAWSVVIVSFIVNILIFVNNGFVLQSFSKQYDSTSKSILIFLIMFSIICFGAWIINFASCLLAIGHLRNTNSFPKDLPLPLLLERILNTCYNKSLPSKIKTRQSGAKEHGKNICCCWNTRQCCSYCYAIAFGYATLVHFLQLVSFHIVYFILGAIASPIGTLCALQLCHWLPVCCNLY